MYIGLSSRMSWIQLALFTNTYSSLSSNPIY